MNTNTSRTTRISCLVAAVLMTLVIHGGMLWTFDSVAQEAGMAGGGQGQIVVKLEPVMVVASRS
jgi:hypothetical protein